MRGDDGDCAEELTGAPRDNSFGFMGGSLSQADELAEKVEKQFLRACGTRESKTHPLRKRRAKGRAPEERNTHRLKAVLLDRDGEKRQPFAAQGKQAAALQNERCGRILSLVREHTAS